MRNVAALLNAAELVNGAALTVHKAQGSGWADLTLTLDWPSVSDEKMLRRWLYTGVTRASRSLLVLDPTLPSAAQLWAGAPMVGRQLRAVPG